MIGITNDAIMTISRKLRFISGCFVCVLPKNILSTSMKYRRALWSGDGRTEQGKPT